MVDRDQQGQLILTCPVCCQVTPVPTNGVTGLQAAFRDNQLLEIVEQYKKAVDLTASLDMSQSTSAGRRALLCAVVSIMKEKLSCSVKPAAT